MALIKDFVHRLLMTKNEEELNKIFDESRKIDFHRIELDAHVLLEKIAGLKLRGKSSCEESTNSFDLFSNIGSETTLAEHEKEDEEVAVLEAPLANGDDLLVTNVIDCLLDSIVETKSATEQSNDTEHEHGCNMKQIETKLDTLLNLDRIKQWLTMERVYKYHQTLPKCANLNKLDLNDHKGFKLDYTDDFNLLLRYGNGIYSYIAVTAANKFSGYPEDFFDELIQYARSTTTPEIMVQHFFIAFSPAIPWPGKHTRYLKETKIVHNEQWIEYELINVKTGTKFRVCLNYDSALGGAYSQRLVNFRIERK